MRIGVQRGDGLQMTTTGEGHLRANIVGKSRGNASHSETKTPPQAHAHTHYILLGGELESHLIREFRGGVLEPELTGACPPQCCRAVRRQRAHRVDEGELGPAVHRRRSKGGRKDRLRDACESGCGIRPCGM